MNDELKANLRTQAMIAAVFNFLINGMITGLIYHNTEKVPTDVVSIAIDMVITCLLTFTITSYFCGANLESAKTAGILPPANGFIHLLARLFRTSLVFGILLGSVSAVVLSAVIAPIFALLGITALPFYLYVLYKLLFSALFGSGATFIAMYAGMCNPEQPAE
jgi:hypothetical protein